MYYKRKKKKKKKKKNKGSWIQEVKTIVQVKRGGLSAASPPISLVTVGVFMQSANTTTTTIIIIIIPNEGISFEEPPS